MQSEIRNDLDDALAHIQIESFNEMLEIFVGPNGLQQMLDIRNDLSDAVPHTKDDAMLSLQNIGDNIAQAMASLETMMTGNEDAQAGRNF
jgi:hypothetical protein